MIIAFASDFHNELGQGQVPLDRKVDVAILAGDISKGVQAVEYAAAYLQEAEHVVMVLGNHDYWGGTYQKVIKSVQEWAAKYPNLHFLNNDTVEIGGVYFIGATLWTDYSYGGVNQAINMVNAEDRNFGMNDYRKIKWNSAGQYRRLRPKDILDLNTASKNYIFSKVREHGEGNCVVVTHHAPSTGSAKEDDALNCCYVNNLDNKIAYEGPKYWIHGHTHTEFNYMVGNTRVMCNPVGYPQHPVSPGFKIFEF